MENNAEQDEIVSNDTGSSSDNQMDSDSIARFNDDALRKRRLAHLLQKNYSMSNVIRWVKYCPDTRCNNYRVSSDIVKHYIEVHQSIPKITIEQDTSYVIPLELEQLEYGKNKSLALLLFPVTAASRTPDDHSTMPLVVLAAKIHPCGDLDYVRSYTNPSNTEDKLIHNGDVLMIWVCGHMPALQTVLKLTSADETRRYVYNGCIHHLTENNHPHMVYTRGNCLLVHALHIASLTDNGTIPLDLSIKIYVE